jgi:hypothetical protein
MGTKKTGTNTDADAGFTVAQKAITNTTDEKQVVWNRDGQWFNDELLPGKTRCSEKNLRGCCNLLEINTTNELLTLKSICLWI